MSGNDETKAPEGSRPKRPLSTQGNTLKERLGADPVSPDRIPVKSTRDMRLPEGEINGHVTREGGLTAADESTQQDADTHSGDLSQKPSNTAATTQGEATNAAKHTLTGNEDELSAEAPTASTHEKDDRPDETPSDADKRSSIGSSAKLNEPQSPIRSHGGNKESISEWSHQILAPRQETVEEVEEEKWQTMPAYADYDIYDDDNKLVARARDSVEEWEEYDLYKSTGGAGKGYTRVQDDEDAQSATSMDEHTAYLFKGAANTNDLQEEDEEWRNPVQQMQATKDLLTENQRIAYIGVVRLAMADMAKDLAKLERVKSNKKQLDIAQEGMKMWTQKMMIKLYGHMELPTAEQVMIEQLAEHGLQAADLTPSLMQNARVKNPVADENILKTQTEPEQDVAPESEGNIQNETMPQLTDAKADAVAEVHREPIYDAEAEIKDENPVFEDAVEAQHEENQDDDKPPPPYDYNNDSDGVPGVTAPEQFPTTDRVDIDIRWTVLCDLFLILVSDAVYDSRSRSLLERVGESLSVSPLEICKFEKRVTEALEMQESAEKENWDEKDHIESRRKIALRRRYMMMGLATVGGGLIIGLSMGALAPVIGAGLAAGFTTIGVTGTSGFLAGAGGAAIIGTTGVVTGGTVGIRAANRRTGSVKTFEYRPLHNNKRVNLIVTVAGWLTGKVDDVRLPFSTVNPVMGDLYSVHWEPEMLTSMGQTISILATEALTQSLQQVLGATILMSLMAALQLPIVLSKLSYLVDNPWSVSVARADLAGLILADSLIDRNLGARPITLVGYSLGSRVIFSCLKELARKGAIGVVQNVFLFGAPVVVNKEDYIRVRAMIPGRFVNGYATKDWILAYLFRATGAGLFRVAGLASVDIPGVENIDVTEFVPGHMAYRKAMPRILQEVGWAVDSLEFTEIEDPDPDNHEKRQRELINEIEEARKEIQEKPEKRRWGLFKTKKLAEKKQWETYDESTMTEPCDTEDTETRAGGNALFDIEAILRETAELTAQGLEVKQLESTLGPLKIDPVKSPVENGTSSHAPNKEDEQPVHEQAQMDNQATPKSQKQEQPIKAAHEDDISNKQADSGEITMTFSPAYDLDVERHASRNASLPISKDPIRDNGPVISPGKGVKGLGRVDLPSVDLSKNAWADENDDDEFGAEKEVSLSFE